VERVLTQHFNLQPVEALNGFSAAFLPDNVQAAVLHSIAHARNAHARFVEAAKNSAKAIEEAVTDTQTSARSLGDKLFNDAVFNAKRSFKAAEEMASAKTIAAAAVVQGKFIQEQVGIGSEQAKELIDLSSKLAKQGFDTYSTALSKVLAQFGKVT
jgi:hypothetical protein